MILHIDELCISYVLFVDVFTRSFDGFISKKFLIAVFLPASRFIPTFPLINFGDFRTRLLHPPRLLFWPKFASLPVYFALPFYLKFKSISRSCDQTDHRNRLFAKVTFILIRTTQVLIFYLLFKKDPHMQGLVDRGIVVAEM